MPVPTLSLLPAPTWRDFLQLPLSLRQPPPLISLLCPLHRPSPLLPQFGLPPRRNTELEIFSIFLSLCTDTASSRPAPILVYILCTDRLPSSAGFDSLIAAFLSLCTDRLSLLCLFPLLGALSSLSSSLSLHCRPPFLPSPPAAAAFPFAFSRRIRRCSLGSPRSQPTTRLPPSALTSPPLALTSIRSSPTAAFILTSPPFESQISFSIELSGEEKTRSVFLFDFVTMSSYCDLVLFSRTPFVC
ncbi:hypothetical protein Scep_012425 [Stephania cephalantha]|uniref:Uncharacterized protein n=1 Tax=Stephania cephalantha TaxID=152367 RepID=A0AAP0JFJ4_9MAGN